DTLILDEPTRNFSPLSGPVIREILSDFGGTVICVTHDRKLIDEVFDTVYALTEEGLIEA
ncbi:MAG: ABC transporter ATP-binding protein, partial [Clostridia bacterium]|nr:ABC transporter ATP-binding protein [Clostridia bacterium]